MKKFDERPKITARDIPNFCRTPRIERLERMVADLREEVGIQSRQISNLIQVKVHQSCRIDRLQAEILELKKAPIHG